MTQALLACSLLWGYKWNGPQSHLGPWLFWSPRNLDPEKFGPREVWAPHEKAMWWFSCGDQISWGPYFSGTKLLGAKISWGPKLLGDQKSQGSKWDWGPFQLQPLVAHLLNATYLLCTSWCMLNPCCLICLSVLKYSCFLSGFKLLHFFVKPSYLVAE